MAFEMEQQVEGHWCWAWLSSSIDRYFDPRVALKQCQIASEVLGSTKACSEPALQCFKIPANRASSGQRAAKQPLQGLRTQRSGRTAEAPGAMWVRENRAAADPVKKWAQR